jgi:hypothetical protein
MVLKKEINVARSFLGDPGMQIAVNETLLLHSNLSATPWRPNSAQVFDDAARGALMGGLEALGHCVIGRFLDAVEPVLAQVFALRFPPDHEVAGRDRRVGPLGSGHCEHIVKFIRRRHRPWSQLIG